MLPQYEKYLQLAQKNKNENKKFLEKLRKQKPAGLDVLIQKLDEEVFEYIDCLECANCCKTTGPLLLNKDIDRLAKELKMRPAIFTENYLKVDEDGDYVFQNKPCPFLGSDRM